MTPEEFIANNPFPSNGTEINNQLVALIQDPSKKDQIKEHTYALFKNNAKLIRVVQKQYNYNQTLGALMSFVYEGIEYAAKEYKLGSPKPFYSFALGYIRGLLQKYYNYKESTVHIPVKKKKIVIAEITDIEETKEELFIDGDNMDEDLDALFQEYGAQKLTGKTLEEFEITKMSRTMTVKEISEKTGLGSARIRSVIKKTVPKLKEYYKKKFLED